MRLISESRYTFKKPTKKSMNPRWNSKRTLFVCVKIHFMLTLSFEDFFLKTHWVRVIDILITYYSIRDKKNFFLILFKISKIKMDLIIFNIEFFFHNFFNNI